MLIYVLKSPDLNPFVFFTTVRTIDALLPERVNPALILFVTLVNVLIWNISYQGDFHLRKKKLRLCLNWGGSVPQFSER